jgi:putative lipoic acid-binding regulatory protein
MSIISEIKKDAKEYPGSYEVGVSGRFKLDDVIVSFIAYTNPQNTTNACYINYTANGRDYSITSHNLDIYNAEQVKQHIRNI